jgi:nucleoside diphosphate kinase
MWKTCNLAAFLLLASSSAHQTTRPRRALVHPGSRSTCLRLRGGKLEHTFAMLKPDIASNKRAVADVKQMITDAGLTIEREERCKLSRTACEMFYAEHKERAFFKDLVKFVTSAPVIKLQLSGDNAIAKWRQLIGPTNSAKVLGANCGIGAGSTTTQR